MRGSFAGCFLDRLGEEARFATAAVAWLSSVTTKETFLEDMTALEFYDEFIDLFDAAPTDVAAGEWVLSLSSSKPLRLRMRRNLKASPRC